MTQVGSPPGDAIPPWQLAQTNPDIEGRLTFMLADVPNLIDWLYESEKRYTWTSLRAAILQQGVQRAVVKFLQMPALLRIIWDAYLEAMERSTPASNRLSTDIEYLVRMEFVRPPTQVQIRSVIEKIDGVDGLGMYSKAAKRLYELANLNFVMRMVPSNSLEGFYHGSLMDAWVAQRMAER